MLEEIKESQFILDSIPSLVWLKDTENNILRVNQAVLDSLGMRRGEVEGKHSSEIYPDDADRFYEDDLAVIASGEPKRGYIEPAADLLVTTDKIPLRNEAGEVYRVLVVATDITDRLRTERERDRIFDLSIDMMCVAGLDGHFKRLNKAWTEVLGHSLEELLDRPFTEFIHEEDLEKTSAAIKSLIEGRPLKQFVNRYRTRDGSYRSLEWTAAPLLKGDDVLYATARDVTEQSKETAELQELNKKLSARMEEARKERERASSAEEELKRVVSQLRFSEDRFRAVVESAPAGLVMVDRQGVIVLANDRVGRLFGYRVDELMGQPIELLVPESLRSEHLELRTAYLKSPDARRLGKGRTLTARRKDGSVFPVEIDLNPISTEGGEYVLSLISDITDRERARIEIEESERRFRNIADSTPLGLWVCDEQSACVWLNKRWLTYTGDTLEESVGEGWTNAVHPDDRESTYKTYLGAFGRRESFSLDYRLRRYDGVYRKHTAIGSPRISKEGVFLGYVGVSIDDHDEREARDELLTLNQSLRASLLELDKTNQELEQFTYIASHDLKAPLRAVEHLATWVQEDLGESLSGDSERHLKQLKQRVGRMEALLNDLLAYSRAGRDRGEQQQINVRELLDQTVSLELAEGFAFDSRLAVDSLVGYRTPLQTVIRNLVGNSIKHHDRSEGHILLATEDAGEMIEFCVTDDGPGIKPELHEKAMAVFQTLRPRDEVEGSGVGLALVKKLVNAEGGKIWIEDNEPRGVAIYFTWPKIASKTSG